MSVEAITILMVLLAVGLGLASLVEPILEELELIAAERAARERADRAARPQFDHGLAGGSRSLRERLGGRVEPGTVLAFRTHTDGWSEERAA